MPAPPPAARPLPAGVKSNQPANTLAFVRQGEVFLMPPGSDPIAVTQGARTSLVAWSRDARRLAYAVQQPGCEAEMRVIDLVTRLDRPVLVGQVAGSQLPDFSADGRRLFAITSEPQPGNLLQDAVVSVDLATGALNRLDQFSPYGGHGGGFPPILRALRWSPLGLGAAWSAGPLPPEVRFLGGDLRPQSHRPSNSPPAWRPNAQQVVISTSDRGLILLDVPAGTEKVLDPTGGTLPAWSPDGARLVYVRRTSEVPQLHVVDVAGGTSTRLLSEAAAFPTWSPDGQWIAYVRQVPVPGPNGYDGRGLSRVRANGSGLELLTPDDGSQAPVFAPQAPGP
jgi:Tol biopolymer transport system component